jgi:hypothetical protein
LVTKPNRDFEPIKRSKQSGALGVTAKGVFGGGFIRGKRRDGSYSSMGTVSLDSGIDPVKGATIKLTPRLSDTARFAGTN